MRSPFSVTLSVWRAIFLREALDRLFDMRGAWFWLLLEPVCHIGFFAFAYGAIQVRTIGGVDYSMWIIEGMLSFFLFRRTAMQVMYAVDCNRALFAYRQVKPFDPAIVRAGLEAFLMAFVSAVILGMAAFLGHRVAPSDPLLIFVAITGLWLFAFGYGLIASVCMELIPESEHILKILMLPLYLISGVIWPLSSIPLPYRNMLMCNPLAHGLEIVRLGFAANYHAVPGVSLGYLLICAVVYIFLGLLLYRRFAVHLVMQ